MITVEKTDKLQATGLTFSAMFIAAFTLGIRLIATEQGKLKAKHPILAMLSFIRAIGNRENDAERDALQAEMIAANPALNGASDEVIEARKAIRSTYENGRVEIAVLRRLHGSDGSDVAGGDYHWTPLDKYITNGKVKDDVIKLFKACVPDFDGHVSDEQLDICLNGMSTVLASAENSPITAQDLGFPVDTMQAFLNGKTDDLALATETAQDALDATETAQTETISA